MAKQRMTYVMSQEAIDKLRKMAYERTVQSGVRVAAGTVLEELILGAAFTTLADEPLIEDEKPRDLSLDKRSRLEKSMEQRQRPINLGIDDSYLDDIIKAG